MVRSARGRGAVSSVLGLQRERVAPMQSGAMAKLMISNLADDVDDNDVRELFARIGPLKSAAITYDRTNRPTGFAEVWRGEGLGLRDDA